MTITRHAIGATMTLPAFWSPASPFPVFADGFQASVASWAPQSDTTRSQVFNTATGLFELRSAWAWTAGVHYGSVVKSFPSVIGKTYRVVATVRADGAAPATARAGMTPGAIVTGGAYVPLDAYGRQVSETITASSTSTFILLNHTDTDDAATVYWQDVAVYELVSSTVLDLEPTAAQITLDESWSPFVRAQITCPIPDSGPLAAIDPRTSQRVTLALTQTDNDSLTLGQLSALYPADTLATMGARFPTATIGQMSETWSDGYNPAVNADLTQDRTLNLMLRARELDHVAGTMTLQLTSDEMALQDLLRYDMYTVDQRPPATASLRQLVNWGLGMVGAYLDESVRTDAVIDPAALQWDAGVSIWSFLDSYIRTNGLRLWCDELRRWYLEPPVTGASGSLTVASVRTLRDVVSREDPAYGDSAVVVYEWVDGAGITQRQYQFAGSPGVTKTVVQRFDTPNPNTSASPAGALRTRALTRGRNISIEAVSDYRADPGQAVMVMTPATVITGAMVSAVTWRFPDDRMEITTRDAV